jgi:hypothetical protein
VKRPGKISILFFVFLIILASCRYSGEDQSFALPEYRKLGMPDAMNLWDKGNYTDACAALNNIKAIRPYSLPRKDSRKSGKLFKRMVSTDNLAFLYDETLSLKERAYRIQQYVDFQGCFLTAYTDINSQTQYYHRELIDLYIFGLTIAQDMLDLGQLINESEYSSDSELIYAYPSIRELYLTMVLTILENQRKSHFFRKNDLEALSEFLSGSVTINREWMSDSDTEKIRHSLQKVITATSSEKIRKMYSGLTGIL